MLAVDAQTLIPQIVDTYARARLYTDKGTLTRELDDGVHFKVEFETAFQRPDYFSFAFSKTLTDASGRAHTTSHRLACARDKIQIDDGQFEHELPKWLDGGVASLTGISGGTAHVIARLLMPNRITGVMLFDAPRCALLGDHFIDEQAHFVVRLRGGGRQDHVFVNRSTLVIRAIDHEIMPPILRKGVELRPGSAGYRPSRAEDFLPGERTDYRAVLTL
jgi:hypothetical protein